MCSGLTAGRDLRQSTGWSPPEWPPPTAASRDDFAAHLGEWMRAQGDNLICAIAETQGRLVGMAWLVIFERVPNPGQRRRLNGDLQSVYVDPEYRGQELGYRLLRVLCHAADERGLVKLTVFSNERATTLYERLGFRDSGLLLERDAGAEERRETGDTAAP